MYMILYNTSVCSFSANPFNVRIESIVSLDYLINVGYPEVRDTSPEN